MLMSCSICSLVHVDTKRVCLWVLLKLAGQVIMKVGLQSPFG